MLDLFQHLLILSRHFDPEFSGESLPTGGRKSPCRFHE